MLDRAGRGARDGGRDDRRAVRRHDDAGRARTLGAAADGAEVARVGDAVEHREQRTLGRRELVAVGVAVGLDEREHALVVARVGAVAQLALELQLRARLGEPVLAP